MTDERPDRPHLREDLGGPVMVVVGLLLGVLALWLTVTTDTTALVLVPPVVLVALGVTAAVRR